jgi:hypothetical protein
VVWDAGEALDGGDGSDHVYGLDLRLPLTARGSGEGGSSADAACHCRGEEEERMEIRQRRRTLRYRKLLVRQNVQLKNKIAQLLMESVVSYNKEKLHQLVRVLIDGHQKKLSGIVP